MLGSVCRWLCGIINIIRLCLYSKPVAKYALGDRINWQPKIYIFKL